MAARDESIGAMKDSMNLKEVTVTFRMVVDEDNIDGARKFHDTLAGFIHQLKRDFNDDLKHSEGRIDFADYAGA